MFVILLVTNNTSFSFVHAAERHASSLSDVRDTLPRNTQKRTQALTLAGQSHCQFHVQSKTCARAGLLNCGHFRQTTKHRTERQSSCERRLTKGCCRDDKDIDDKNQQRCSAANEKPKTKLAKTPLGGD